MAFARGAFARGARALIRVPLASTPALRGAPPLTRAGFSSAAARAWDPDGRFASAGRDSRASSSSSTAASFPVPFSSRPAAARAASSSAPSSVGKLVIVESPAKATKVQTYLGPGYTVVASYGHVRDLVEKSGSVVPEEDFAMRWAERARDGVVRELISSAKRADAIILATDPDREGEAISWHIVELLKERGVVPRESDAPGEGVSPGSSFVSRVTFTEVTKSAVLAAFAQPRELSAPLVDAYLARRALDYLFGFNLSGVLWRKMPSAERLSAGRVQSVALRLVCDREFEIERFVKEERWSVTANVRSSTENVSDHLDDSFVAELTHVRGRKLGKAEPASRAHAEECAAAILTSAGSFRVADVSEKDVKRRASPPFTTSTMQQEASSRLGFGAGRTMSAAQALYEGRGWGEGLITYMRTDGLFVSPGAVAELRAVAGEAFGPAYVPAKPAYYKKTQKNAQEAHEAIRPTNPRVAPGAVANRLGAGSDEARLYALVWARTMASQMSPAVTKRVAAVVGDGEALETRLRATGSRLLFPGYLAAYEKASLAGKGRGAGADTWLPALEVGGEIALVGDGVAIVERDKDAPRGGFRRGEESEESEESEGGEGDAEGDAADELPMTERAEGAAVVATQHWTQPPGRYTEGTLVRALEEKGVGRPSTYASILRVITKRGYVRSSGGRGPLVPETRGRLVSSFLSHFFGDYVDYGFTAGLEDRLDDVASGKETWKGVLADFWMPFATEVEALKKVRTSLVVDVLDATLGGHFFGDDEEALERRVRLAEEAAEAFARGDASDDPGGDAEGDAFARLPFDANDLSLARRCPSCDDGRLGLKFSRTGGFIGCSNYPSCEYSRGLLANAEGLAPDANEVSFPKRLGTDPATRRTVTMLNGPYGAYLQLDAPTPSPEAAAAAERAEEVRAAAELARLEKEAAEESEAAYARATKEALAAGKKPPRKKKPKKVKLGKKRKEQAEPARRFGLRNLDVAPRDVTLDLALALLEYPVVLGEHPSEGGEVTMNAGPFGWYVSHAGTNASLPKKTVKASRDEAVRLAEEAAEAAGERDDERAAAAVLRARHGPVSLETAVEVLERKRSKPAGGKGRGWGRGKKKSDAEAGDADANDKSAKRAKKKKDAAAPAAKRPPSAYLLYCAEARETLPEGMKVPEQAKMLGAQWKALGEEEKARFQAQAAEAKEAAAAAAPTAKTKAKRPPSAYLLYCAEARGALPEGMKVPEQAKMLGAQWKALGEEEKARFQAQAAEAKEAAAGAAA